MQKVNSTCRVLCSGGMPAVIAAHYSCFAFLHLFF